MCPRGLATSLPRSARGVTRSRAVLRDPPSVRSPAPCSASVAPLCPSRAHVVARVCVVTCPSTVCLCCQVPGGERGSGIPPGLRATHPGHANRPPSPGDDGIIALTLCADLERQALERPTRWPRSWPGSPPRSTPAYSGLGLPTITRIRCRPPRRRGQTRTRFGGGGCGPSSHRETRWRSSWRDQSRSR